MKLNLKYVIAIALLGLFFGCSHSKKAGNDESANAEQSGAESTRPNLPKPDHIVVVIEENHGYNQIIGTPKTTPQTPYINKLANEGALFTDSHGVTHPSQGNYLAIFSGSLQGVTNDHCLGPETPYTTPNLGAALFAKGYTFKGYAQNLPSIGSEECNYLKSALTGGTVYARKHCPWVNWQGNKENNFPGDSVSFPMTDFPSDFSKLPTISFVIPDQDHDMHNNSSDTAIVRMADDWLQSNLSKYIEWANSHNSLLILTYDEYNFTKDNHIPTIFVGPMVKQGKYNENINHYSVLRTIEHMYGLEKSGPGQGRSHYQCLEIINEK